MNKLRITSNNIAFLKEASDALGIPLQIEESNLSVVLSLVDQLYEVRRDLRRLLSAVEAQPEDVRVDITKRVTTKT